MSWRAFQRRDRTIMQAILLLHHPAKVMAGSRITEGDWSAKNDGGERFCAVFRAGFGGVLYYRHCEERSDEAIQI